jgi:hypothetical protein
MNTLDKHPETIYVTHRLFELIADMSYEERKILVNLLEGWTAKSDDRRKYYRKPLNRPLTKGNKNRGYDYSIRNIGFGGAFISTNLPIPVGRKISISFSMPGYQNSIHIIGQVVRTTPEGIGVSFKPASKGQKAKIVSLLAMY